jgi:hypothetical protein
VSAYDAAAMTRAERIELSKLARKRARVAKTAVDSRAAELRADVERQLSASYKSTDEAWADVTATARQAVAAADQVVAAKCRELGIPDEFRPGLNVYWHSRGANAERDIRAELRRVAHVAIEAQAKQAKTTIEAKSLDVETELLTGGLTSSAGRRFLDSMPTPVELMPVIDVKAIGGNR